MSENNTGKNDVHSRRDFVDAAGKLAAAGAVGGLAGCLGESGDEAVEAGEVPSTNEELYSSVDVDSVSLAAVGTADADWEPWTEATGASVDFSSITNNPPDVANMFLNGNAENDYDVMMTFVDTNHVLTGEGFLENIPLNNLPNWDDVYDEAKGDRFIADERLGATEQFNFPFISNGDSFGFLEEHVGSPSQVQSYGVLIDDEFAGYTGSERSAGTTQPKFSLYMKNNNLAEFDDTTSPSEDDIDTVVRLLAEEREEGQFRTFWTGWEQAVNLFINEEVWAMNVWEPVVGAVNAEGIDAHYADVPDEGWNLWSHAPMATTGGAENTRSMQAFLNYLMGPEASASNTDEFEYLTPNSNAAEYATEREDLDSEKITEIHDRVLRRFENENSELFDMFGDNFQYMQDQYNQHVFN